MTRQGQQPSTSKAHRSSWAWEIQITLMKSFSGIKKNDKIKNI